MTCGECETKPWIYEWSCPKCRVRMLLAQPTDMARRLWIARMLANAEKMKPERKPDELAVIEATRKLLNEVTGKVKAA